MTAAMQRAKERRHDAALDRLHAAQQWERKTREWAGRTTEKPTQHKGA
jgi:hypothetical protein